MIQHLTWHTWLDSSKYKLNEIVVKVFEKVSIQRCDGGEVQHQEDFDRLGAKSLYAFIYPNFMVNRQVCSVYCSI